MNVGIKVIIMQYKNNKKIIIDQRKLEFLFRLGCPDKQIIELLKTGDFTSTGDNLIDETLESLLDFKVFENWGGARKKSGRKAQKTKKNNHLDFQDENHVENHLENQDDGQVVDKDIDKDIYINNIFNNNNIYKQETKKSYGEFGKVKLTDEEHNKLKDSYGKDLDVAIRILDDYLASKGKKYASHYAVMKKNGWVWTETMKQSINNFNEFDGFHGI